MTCFVVDVLCGVVVGRSRLLGVKEQVSIRGMCGSVNAMTKHMHSGACYNCLV